MKRIVYLSIFLLAATSGCKKQDSLADLIVGRWTLVSSYANAGSGTSNYAATSTHPIVIFKDDGTLAGDAFPGFGTYKFNQASVVFTGSAGSATYGYSFPDNKLQLNYVGCTDGCGLRFVKVP